MISVVFVLAVVLPIASIIAKVRSDVSLNLIDVITEYEYKIDSSDATIGLFTKFNSVTNGVLLIDSYGVGNAGFAPYIGSALIFLPRVIFPGRPVAGSIDGTIYGTLVS